MAIELIGQELNLDEYSMGLLEVNMTSSVPGEGVQRHQIIRVIRWDSQGKACPHNFVRKMGKAEDFTAEQFWIAGGVMTLKNGEIVMIPIKIPYDDIRHYNPLHSVGELLDRAERQRDMPNMQEIFDIQPENYMDMYINEMEDRLRISRRQSVFGPMFVRQFSDTGLDR